MRVEDLMSAMPTETLVPGDDREHRDRRLLRASIWSEVAGQQDALIRNISPNGLGGSVEGSKLFSGMSVVVTLFDGLQVTGTVRWTRGNAFGLRLSQDIDPGAFASELRKQMSARHPTGEWQVGPRHRFQAPASFGPLRRL